MYGTPVAPSTGTGFLFIFRGQARPAWQRIPRNLLNLLAEFGVSDVRYNESNVLPNRFSNGRFAAF